MDTQTVILAAVPAIGALVFAFLQMQKVSALQSAKDNTEKELKLVSQRVSEQSKDSNDLVKERDSLRASNQKAQSEVDALKKKLHAAEDNVKAARAEADQAKEDASESQSSATKKLEGQVKSLEKELESAKKEATQATQASQKLESQQKSAADAATKLQAQLAAATKEATAAKSAATQAENELKKVQAEIKTLSQELERLRADTASSQQKIKSAEEATKAAEKKRADAEAEIEKVLSKSKKLEQDLAKAKEELETLKTQAKESSSLQSVVAEKTAELAKAAKAQDELRQSVVSAEKARDQSKAQSEKAAAENAKLHGDVSNLRRTNEQLTRDVEQLRAHLPAVERERDSYKQKYETEMNALHSFEQLLDKLNASIVDTANEADKVSRLAATAKRATPAPVQTAAAPASTPAKKQQQQPATTPASPSSNGNWVQPPYASIKTPSNAVVSRSVQSASAPVSSTVSADPSPAKEPKSLIKALAAEQPAKAASPAATSTTSTPKPVANGTPAIDTTAQHSPISHQQEPSSAGEDVALPPRPAGKAGKNKSSATPSKEGSSQSSQNPETPPAKQVHPGSSKDDYEFLKCIGTGASCRVYLVRSKHNNELYALKAMGKAHMLQTGQEVHVISERKILSELDHPFIVKMVHHWQEPDHLYILFEYLVGWDMFELIESHKGAGVGRAAAIFYSAEILLALEYIHSKGIVWRDMKPENLMVNSDGHIKVTDFGYAKKIGSSGRTYTKLGTPEYMAPELWDESYGHEFAADWWALGVLIYELLAGDSPFANEDPQAMCDNIMIAKYKFPKSMDEEARSLIRGLLQPMPENRLTVDRIKKHPFFRSVDWDSLAQKKVKPVPMPDPKNAPEVELDDTYDPYNEDVTIADIEAMGYTFTGHEFDDF